MKTPIALAAFAALLMLTPAAQAWPPCTCDPNPVLDCLVNGEGCPTAPELPPEVPEVIDIDNLDPRNWPCTCDPILEWQ